MVYVLFFNENEKFKTRCGSPCYASPECIQGQKYDARKSDIWSLGVILYEMIFKTQPWDISNTSQMMKTILSGNYKIPPGYPVQPSELIQGMLKINPNERLTTEQILKHPWIKKCAPRMGLSSSSIKSYSTDALNPLKLSSVQQSIKRQESDKIYGVVSPFKDLEGSPINKSKRNVRFSESLKNLSPKISKPTQTFSTVEENDENLHLK